MLEVPLPKDTSDGQIHSSGIMIKFALTVEARGGIDAEELQATDAVDRATEMVSALSPTPQIVDLADPEINAGTNVAARLQTFENTWGVLLQRMALFNKIAAGIAEVFGIVQCLPSSSERCIDSPLHFPGLVCDIGCKPGVCVARHALGCSTPKFIPTQVLVNQHDRDDRVVRLAGMMSDVFTFVEDAETLKAVKTHKEPIRLLIQQVTECGYFIAEYAKQNNFCQSSLALHCSPLISIRRDPDCEIHILGCRCKAH